MNSKSTLSKEDVNVEPQGEKFINILLLGETGVGKSTFINSIANYLKYENFKDAEKGNLLVHIPSKALVRDISGKIHIIEIGENDQNKCLDAGMSATQGMKTYMFPIQEGKLMLRLIDTPGIGDGRDIDQDNENCKNILGYIGQLKELHAICYLFQSSIPTRTIFFEYCLMQILSRLDKSASDNIVFIFTNTRGTNYGPGDALLSLQRVIQVFRARPPHIEIKLDKNVFCFDNEAFKNLAAIQKDIRFSWLVKKWSNLSWKRSFEAFNKFITYVVGDEDNPPLKPYLVQSTKTVNDNGAVEVQKINSTPVSFQIEGNNERLEEEFINILLLGETGIGKSMVINTLANYLTYGDSEEAEKGNLLTLIPCRCAVKDKFGKFHCIEIEKDDQNECLDTRKSATQGVTSYVFPIQEEELMIRLIDTPSITGDGRDIEKDNENCENILGYIGQLKELHAICLFFQPTNSRIPTLFEYCMTQIFSRLDRFASNNIIFIFTDNGGTAYGPSGIQLSLQNICQHIRTRAPHINIKINKNAFCFNNEAFRYLAAAQKGIQLDEVVKKKNILSWKGSFETCNKLIKYIIGDENNPPLKPHFIQGIKTLNETTTHKAQKEGNVKHQEVKFINILLLGETGVGKSTIINSIANYLTYGDFEEAEKGNLLALIPSKSEVTDKFGEVHTVEIGKMDQNECLDAGKSATQGVKTYVFPVQKGELMLRLIDTPGIGDGRGIGRDNENCENILGYIGQLKELHAICYLFQPTNSRITIFFDYCMTQILSRLDKSASDNIIFIFTNTRGTDYTPGNTLLSLREVIKELKASPPYADIKMNKNVFCFDNEAFKYLAAAQQGIQFTSVVKQRNIDSWKESFESCAKLMKYIVGDENNPPLTPHAVQSTKAINEARRVIVQLSQPLADVIQLIANNILSLEMHKKSLQMESQTLEELREKLYMPIIDLEVTPLSKPVTVCTTVKCSEVYQVGNVEKWHYKQRCHDPCYLKDVPSEMIGSPLLLYCDAMSSGQCKICECRYSTHMHVYYMTETVDSTVIDSNVQQNVDDKEKVMKEVTKIIENSEKKMEELRTEHSIIVKTCARFTQFLKKNAIMPFSDSYRQYINMKITNEKGRGDQANKKVLSHLQKLLQEYDAMKRVFEEADFLPEGTETSDLVTTPEKIQECIQELYELKHNGNKVRVMYECQNAARSREHTYQEYVHRMPCKFWRGLVKGANYVKKKVTNKNSTRTKGLPQGSTTNQKGNPKVTYRMQ